jgi:hypothetical protein
MRISRGFFNVSCIFVDTYKAAKEAYWGEVSVTAASYTGRAQVVPDTESASVGSASADGYTGSELLLLSSADYTQNQQ